MIILNKYDEYGQGMGYPSMKDFFEKKPYEGQKEIVEYLKAGRKTFAAAGLFKDFYTGEYKSANYAMTDETFTWMSSLIYYVERYNLRLPQEFENHVLNN